MLRCKKRFVFDANHRGEKDKTSTCCFQFIWPPYNKKMTKGGSIHPKQWNCNSRKEEFAQGKNWPREMRWNWPKQKLIRPSYKKFNPEVHTVYGEGESLANKQIKFRNWEHDLGRERNSQQLLGYQFSNSQFNCNSSEMGAIDFPFPKSPNDRGQRVVGISIGHQNIVIWRQTSKLQS